MKPAGAIPEGPGSSAPKRMTPLNEGSRPTPGASSITSDGGEANLFILAEQPGDDARAGTVSNQAQIALAYLRASRSFRSGPWFKPRFVDRGW